MVPASTACAPSQSTNTIALNTSTITTPVSQARARMRRSAVSNAASTAPPKRPASNASCRYDCTVGMALSTSPASALAFATLSWLARDSRRTRRPNMTTGATTTSSVPMM